MQTPISTNEFIKDIENLVKLLNIFDEFCSTYQGMVVDFIDKTQEDIDYDLVIDLIDRAIITNIKNFKSKYHETYFIG